MEENVYTYKEYAVKHFGRNYNLGALCVPHFHPDAYGDVLSKLELYLKQLAGFSKVLTKAARLRQQHYERFLEQSGAEDDGHRYWRIAMNDIAADAREKLALWTQYRNQELDEAIARYAAEPLPLVFQVTSRLVNPEPDVVTKQKPKKRVCRPPLSRAEKRRRKRERHRATDALLQAAIEDAKRKQVQMLNDMMSMVTTNAVEKHNISFRDLIGALTEAEATGSLKNAIIAIRNTENVLLNGDATDMYQCLYLLTTYLLHACMRIVKAKPSAYEQAQESFIVCASLCDRLDNCSRVHLAALFAFLNKMDAVDHWTCVFVSPFLGEVNVQCILDVAKFTHTPEDSVKLLVEVYRTGCFIVDKYALMSMMLIFKHNGVKKIDKTKFKAFGLHKYYECDLKRATYFKGYKIEAPPPALVHQVQSLQRDANLLMK